MANSLKRKLPVFPGKKQIKRLPAFPGKKQIKRRKTKMFYAFIATQRLVVWPGNKITIVSYKLNHIINKNNLSPR